MRLSDRDIELWIKNKKLVIEPIPNKELIHGVTIDVRLGNEFYTFCNKFNKNIDLSKSRNEISKILKKVMNKKHIIPNDHVFLLKPGMFVLAITLEKIFLPNNLVGWLDGRSSLARLGLMIHATSHRIDPGWGGNIVLEFFNSSNMILSLCPGMLIAAVSFEILSSPSIRPYNIRKNAKYFNQSEVTFSRIDQD
ncbi:deoxycytidine triphosphate deaminase [Buchnera aphidicola str. Bp (Baizongia pistaciae)]|uniref:dCTP deaminase n=1 Tax=Buchnera aphidicola subsp. Baizongia pistaciae (strain Bp) TaxID=224915 RepID=DCD_BUCBP|nr:dCTP deaminase [Buchnera aphidicola]P59464.1 RecName: Full=dCTP deaminase; AltName: Full=Deoxycytidine triphosphate deaminase [Buchnera aphidicola str. Bp (Baizongia pistaciae)]AAO26837.1 deoxycytidine triphosphate deaminase [Buchnera aphidicola str. Bp (Baizongia pistaciae)]